MQLFITPSKNILKTAISLVVTMVVLIIAIGSLQYREKVYILPICAHFYICNKLIFNIENGWKRAKTWIATVSLWRPINSRLLLFFQFLFFDSSYWSLFSKMLTWLLFLKTLKFLFEIDLFKHYCYLKLIYYFLKKLCLINFGIQINLFNKKILLFKN